MRNLILVPLFFFLESAVMMIHPGEPIPKRLVTETYVFYLAKFLGTACSIGIIRNLYLKKRTDYLFLIYMLCICAVTSVTITVLMAGFE